MAPENIITLYGRKPVLEVLQDASIEIYRLHLADSNRQGGVIRDIEQLAERRGIETVYHERLALSRISKNGRQDQGVAIDISAPGYRQLSSLPAGARNLVTLDGVTNPQNLGMIIRTVAASPMDGLVLPRKGCARLDPLVHKASAGTLIRASIFHCPTLGEAFETLRAQGFTLVGLDGAATGSLADLPPAGEPGTPPRYLFILGNETTGLGDATRDACDRLVSIPLFHGIESLNVAAAAALVAFRETFGAAAD